ncbi:MAG: hypothetical protein ACOYMV_01270 [Verrucomicrobiia bacterium]
MSCKTAKRLRRVAGFSTKAKRRYTRDVRTGAVVCADHTRQNYQAMKLADLAS